MGIYQVKGLGGAILEVSTQAGFQVLGGHIPLGLRRLLCTAVQLTQVQRRPVPHLSGHPGKILIKTVCNLAGAVHSASW